MVTASWFLLRGIELANVECQDVSFNKERREVSLKLPVSKTDVRLRGAFGHIDARASWHIQRIVGARKHRPFFSLHCRLVRVPEDVIACARFMRCSAG